MKMDWFIAFKCAHFRRTRSENCMNFPDSYPEAMLFFRIIFRLSSLKVGWSFLSKFENGNIHKVHFSNDKG